LNILYLYEIIEKVTDECGLRPEAVVMQLSKYQEYYHLKIQVSQDEYVKSDLMVMRETELDDLVRSGGDLLHKKINSIIQTINSERGVNA